VSLLLDALKRAEQEKLARQGEASNDAPAAQPAPGPRPAPNLELQPLGAPVPAAPAAARGDEPAHAAQVMFDAKVAAQDAKRGRGMLWATLGAIAIVVASAAAYVWYQIRVLSPGPATAVARRGAPPPFPQAAASEPPPATAIVDQPVGTPATVTIASDPMPVIAPPPAEPAPRVAAAGKESADPDPVARLLRDAPAAPAAAPLKLARSLERPAIPADVSSGYAALRRGDLAEARRRYEAALAADPMSLDARLGIATAEARSGNRSVAQLHYRLVLELDPRNATALAGLAALAEGLAPQAVEQQLREDVARFPESAALRFALGSHYAAERRWGEAQAAFYEAHRLEPGSADILYNLAVSLDHMSQQRLAADYYRRAVEAAQSQPTQFDPAPVRRRIAELAAR
jgi:tetratricopeptide (TPR) repeat protein